MSVATGAVGDPHRGAGPPAPAAGPRGASAPPRPRRRPARAGGPRGRDDRTRASGRSSGITATRLSSAAQAQVGNQASSKTSPSAVDSAATASPRLPVPRLRLHAARGDVEVERDRGRGQQPDRAEQALVDGAVVGRRPAAHAGTATPPGRAAGRASRRTPPARPSRGCRRAGRPGRRARRRPLAQVERQRGAVRRIGDEPQLGQGQATRRGSPSSRSCGAGRGGPRSMVGMPASGPPGRRAG